jgi:hypothetical protein
MTERPNMLSVYDGQHCTGFVINRGKVGHEAFDSQQVSLGIYRTATEAADAITAAQQRESTTP